MKKYNKATLSIVKIENTAIMATSTENTTNAPVIGDSGFVGGARSHNGEDADLIIDFD